MKLWCWLFGHKWKYVQIGKPSVVSGCCRYDVACVRCGDLAETVHLLPGEAQQAEKEGWV